MYIFAGTHCILNLHFGIICNKQTAIDMMFMIIAKNWFHANSNWFKIDFKIPACIVYLQYEH